MRLKEYKENYNNAPYELYEFAEEAEKIDDCYELSKAAYDYREAMIIFREILEKYGIEVG